MTLLQAIAEYGVRWAPKNNQFVLANGTTSRFYIDLTKVAMTPEGMTAIVKEAATELKYHEFDGIGGPSSGADPIIGALMTRLKCNGFMVRKRIKGRGPNELIEGYIRPDSRVVVLEDVTTSGKSLLRAIKKVEAAGAKVVHALSLLDREAGAAELLADYGFTALTKLSQLGLKVNAKQTAGK
jgi:orotate phosphoribosyltransferase